MASLRPRYHFRAAPECSVLISEYRWAMPRSAREVMLTRKAMRGFKLVEKLLRGPGLSFFCVRQALTDTFLNICAGSDVEQALIGFSILHDRGGLSLHSKHHGALALLELFHEVAGAAAEGGQRLDVTRNVQHWLAPTKAPF